MAGDARALLSTRDGRLMVFDGTTATPWAAQARNDLTGRISGLRHLLDGGTAVAITGRGLFLISEKGELFTTLTSSDYHRITAMETREAGVLWTIGEDGVKKIHYGSPLSVFGQRLGLTLSWPIVVGWNGKVIVASGGRLFEAIPGGPGSASRFELNKNSPVDGSWTIAASGSQLLVGNNRGLHIMTPDGSLTRIGADMDIARIVPLENGLCFAIGRTEIAVFRSNNGQCAECAPRIASPGHPSVVHAARESVWIELGMTRVVRVSLRDGKIQSRVFEDFPWKDAHWVNVGIIDDTIILSGPPGKRLFFDETTETFTQAAVLQRLLERSPQWILRVRKDAAGTIWATHEQGVVTFEPHDGEYLMDATTFELNNEHFPLVQFLPGNDVWVSTGQSLYHVEEHHAHAPPSTLQPILVSIMDGKTNAELFQQESVSTPAPALRLPYAQNNLSFRFFAGSYTWRRTPIYEFRLNGGPDRWTNLGTGSLISFSGLREGTYQLEVRIANSRGSAGLPTTTNFQVLPPWHRTLPAYLLYGLGAGLAVFGLLRWSIHHTRHRNIALENLVRERTEQLTAAMEKLNEETRNAATLAERDRLAGEIHDSLQQGLSGLILQLDATLKLPTLTADVRTRLNVARNMVSFTRHEVQHAVWDMESPLLEDTELGEALRKLTSLINSGAGRIEIDVTGTPQALPSATKHHLLRIAQEAITNAVRHASATNITVRLDYQPEAVCLTISDDGVGFQPDDVLEKSIGHFGLRGLRGRAKKIGGILAIKSLLGEGTLIEIKVPLSAYLNSPRDVVTAPSVV
jgi:signal transduction histidine kinase